MGDISTNDKMLFFSSTSIDVEPDRNPDALSSLTRFSVGRAPLGRLLRWCSSSKYFPIFLEDFEWFLPRGVRERMACTELDNAFPTFAALLTKRVGRRGLRALWGLLLWEGECVGWPGSLPVGIITFLRMTSSGPLAARCSWRPRHQYPSPAKQVRAKRSAAPIM